MRAVVTCLLIGLSASCMLSQDARQPSWTVVDLTHTFDETTVYWPTADGFELRRGTAGVTERGFYYEAHGFATAEHGGTHIDAPIHFHADRWRVDEIPVDRLFGPGVVVDVREACAADPDYRIGVTDFESWEREHGRLPDGAIVLLHTGFGAFWPDRTRYMGTDERGPQAVARLHFPGLDPAAASWLAEQRSIAVIGLDTPSIDHGPSQDFASHVRLFADNIPALENVASLDRLPPGGFLVAALPMKIGGGSGAPTRIIALLPADP